MRIIPLHKLFETTKQNPHLLTLCLTVIDSSTKIFIWLKTGVLLWNRLLLSRTELLQQNAIISITMEQKWMNAIYIPPNEKREYFYKHEENQTVTNVKYIKEKKNFFINIEWMQINTSSSSFKRQKKKFFHQCRVKTNKYRLCLTEMRKKKKKRKKK
jgi:hypothetical protein